MNKCKYCETDSLVLSTANKDYRCEYCGEWQSAILNDVWAIIGYEGECDKCNDTYELSDRTSRCGDCGNCNKCCTHEREGK